jgi:hypothetical protein
MCGGSGSGGGVPGVGAGIEKVWRPNEALPGFGMTLDVINAARYGSS